MSKHSSAKIPAGAADLAHNPKSDLLKTITDKARMQEYIDRYVREHSHLSPRRIIANVLHVCDCYRLSAPIVQMWQTVLQAKFPVSSIAAETSRRVKKAL